MLFESGIHGSHAIGEVQPQVATMDSKLGIGKFAFGTVMLP
jgi:hypothetical protein